MVTTLAAPRVRGRVRPRPEARPAAASTLAPSWLHGERAVARVVGVFGASAAYLLRDGEVLPVLAPGALVLPGGLRVAGPEDLRRLGLRVGDDVVAGGGEVLSPSGGLVVRRTWRPTRVPTGDLAPGALATVRSALLGTPDLTRDLPRDLVDVAASSGWGASGCARELLGRGPGLTPAGDDVLCGMLLALRASGRAAARADLEREVAPLLARTTALSATLLRQAAAGYAVPALVDLLTAWHHDPRPAHLAQLAAEVAAVGHTSGRALLLGLRVVLDADPTRARRHTADERGPS